MRLTAKGPLLALTVAACAVCVGGATLLVLRDGSGSASSPEASFVSATKAADMTRPRFKPETRNDLGRFDLSMGGRVSVSTAQSVDGKECLIEDDDQGESSSCFDDGLFSTRKAELVVSSMGGPEQFDEVHVTGVVAAGIRSARLVKTDGTGDELDLNARRAFLYQSSASDLEARIYPTAVRLYGPNGKLVETVDFPAAG
jgi:hypothetical protein